MKQLLKIVLLLVMFFQGYAMAGSHSYNDMVLDSKNSAVSFATIKKQYVVEPATFDISGTIDDGTVTLNVKIDSVDTAISIRNDRLKDLFFESTSFPSATITTKLDKKLLTFKNVKRATVPFTITIFGNKKVIEAPILMAKAYNKKLVVTSTKPIIIKASDFGIPADNLTKLAETVGGIAISNTVPVNFVLTFHNRKK